MQPIRQKQRASLDCAWALSSPPNLLSPRSKLRVEMIPSPHLALRQTIFISSQPSACHSSLCLAFLLLVIIPAQHLSTSRLLNPLHFTLDPSRVSRHPEFGPVASPLLSFKPEGLIAFDPECKDNINQAPSLQGPAPWALLLRFPSHPFWHARNSLPSTTASTAHTSMAAPSRRTIKNTIKPEQHSL